VEEVAELEEFIEWSFWSSYVAEVELIGEFDLGVRNNVLETAKS